MYYVCKIMQLAVQQANYEEFMNYIIIIITLILSYGCELLLLLTKLTDEQKSNANLKKHGKTENIKNIKSNDEVVSWIENIDNNKKQKQHTV